jgi:hypothetical protein
MSVKLKFDRRSIHVLSLHEDQATGYSCLQCYDTAASGTWRILALSTPEPTGTWGNSECIDRVCSCVIHTGRSRAVRGRGPVKPSYKTTARSRQIYS